MPKKESKVIDGDKLSNKYEIIPYQDLATKQDVEKSKLTWDKESEERVIGELGIAHIKKYLIGVRIHYDLLSKSSKLSLNEYLKLLEDNNIKIIE